GRPARDRASRWPAWRAPPARRRRSRRPAPGGRRARSHHPGRRSPPPRLPPPTARARPSLPAPPPDPRTRRPQPRSRRARRGTCVCKLPRVSAAEFGNPEGVLRRASRQVDRWEPAAARAAAEEARAIALGWGDAETAALADVAAARAWLLTAPEPNA